MTDKFEKDKELFTTITSVYNDKVPFNKVIGLEVASLDYDHVVLTFKMRDELIGNYIRRTLHGGVISTVIDVTGSLVAFMGLQKKMHSEALEKKLDRFRNLSTLDLRVDYLRPGLGTGFTSTGYELRTGKKVAVTRIELHNDQKDLIAVGTGSYVVS